MCYASSTFPVRPHNRKRDFLSYFLEKKMTQGQSKLKKYIGDLSAWYMHNGRRRETLLNDSL